jgi:lipopolysaccharide export system permease protein
MKLLDRYLFREFSRNLLLVLATLLAVYFLVDFFETIDNIIEAQEPMTEAARFYLLKIPFVIEQLMPVSLLLAGIITLGLANHHLEVIALKAAGIQTSRIVRPIIGCGLFFTMLTLAMCQWLVPVTMSAANKFWYEEVRKNTNEGLILRKNRIFYRGAEGFYSFDEQPVITADHYSNFSYATWDNDYRQKILLFARRAEWQQGQWFFYQGQVTIQAGHHEPEVTIFDQITLQLPENPSNLLMPEHKFSERSISELFSRTKAVGEFQKQVAWLDFHKKISYNTLGLPLLLLGLPMLLLIHQRWGRDLALAIPASCLLTFLAWTGWGTLQTMAKADYLHAAPASWSIHALIGGLGLLLLYRQDC